MYQSRLHATNGIVSIAVDALNGEILEFTRESTWDNAAKNHVRSTRSLLDGLLHTSDGDRRLYVPRYLEIREDGRLTPDIAVEQRDKSARVTITYPMLVTFPKVEMDGAGKPVNKHDYRLPPLGEPVDISATVTIELPENECRTLWRLAVENRTDGEIDQICFPSMDGLWLGESWEDDMLVIPHHAGLRTVNPTKNLASVQPRINWKWQEYIYGYNLGHLSGARDDRGAYVVEMSYSGAASMLWMDLYDPGEGTGLYITCRNERLIMKGLRLESFGEQYPGVGLAIVHKPCLKQGAWESEECVVAFHEGDWHWGADDYRAWFGTLNRPDPGHHRPLWFEKSAGLIAHYDFQYQGGGIVHRFSDIPELLRQAQALGFNHLLLSGWNEDGFDFGFPHYKPNHKLGTEQELKDALAEVKRMGGHVAFYVNSRLCNTGFEDQQERIKKSAVMDREGKLHIEKYGAADVYFASLCINDTEWRNELADVVRYLTHEIGADSMYLDQLAMGGSCKCYHPGHAEHRNNPIAWNQGYEKLLARMRSEYDPEGMALIYEGCNDNFGPGASGQLITVLSGPLHDWMPEVYKYTFPEQILVDMMNARRNSAMRPEHVARHSTELLHRAFVNGSYLWCYDLEWDNTWRRDPEQWERLRKIVALRTAWLDRYGQGRFTDVVGVARAPEGQMIKRYEIEGGLLAACACESGLSGTVFMEWPGDNAPRVECMTLDRPEPLAIPCRVESLKGKRCVAFDLPETEMAVAAIRT
ncbi:MAG: hypothetical protein J5602_03125 [Clostridia bacterium]|nr:hypothetical protein [Clostridia bacterium]